MADRLAKVQRIQSVQATMHRLAEWRLAELQRHERELAERQQEMIHALNGDQRLHGLFVSAMARRLKALAGEEERTRAAREAQADRVLDEAKRLKRTERLVDRVEIEHRREAEKHELQRLIEGLGARPRDASLP